MDFEETKQTITLHGLGFVQVKLGGMQRLHVWHPDLPRRRCFEHSAVHNHRFGFKSVVLRGQQINDVYAVLNSDDLGWEATHQAYLHEGERLSTGNRPWVPEDEVWICHVNREVFEVGDTYRMPYYIFHSTTPGGNGKVATLMTKLYEGDRGSRSLCDTSETPDADFDRFQLSEDELWNFVRDVLEG